MVVSAPAIIRTEGLTRTFGNVRAVDGLDLEIPAGTVFGFLGPNGAGKTTTIRLLLGLLEPTGGRATVLGFDTDRTPRPCGRGRARCSSIMPLRALSAEDNLAFYARVWRVDGRARERIRALLERWLWTAAQSRSRAGARMKQKLAVARALLHRPSLLFLDEPTAGLDRSPRPRCGRTGHAGPARRRHGVPDHAQSREAERLCAGSR